MILKPWSEDSSLGSGFLGSFALSQALLDYLKPVQVVKEAAQYEKQELACIGGLLQGH